MTDDGKAEVGDVYEISAVPGSLFIVQGLEWAVSGWPGEMTWNVTLLCVARPGRPWEVGHPVVVFSPTGAMQRVGYTLLA